MDECPAMKECWLSAMRQHPPRKVTDANRYKHCSKWRWKQIPNNVEEALQMKINHVATTVDLLRRQVCKAQVYGRVDRSNLGYEDVNGLHKNPLSSLCTLAQQVWEKTLALVQQKKSGPLLASATTTALSSIPTVQPLTKSDALQKKRDPFFDLFLDGRDLDASRLRTERPAWVSEPSETTRSVACGVAQRAVEGWSGFICPVDQVWEVSSGFGPRWGRWHNGVDLAAPSGEPVLAADSGQVTYAGWEPSGYGYLVEITHRDGWKTLYAHNSKIFTWEGSL